jgi:hypothetical protein
MRTVNTILPYAQLILYTLLELILQTAWRNATNEDIAASIIGFIRKAALGDALIPYSDRVDRSLKQILASRAWTRRSVNGWNGLVSKLRWSMWSIELHWMKERLKLKEGFGGSIRYLTGN